MTIQRKKADVVIVGLGWAGCADFRILMRNGNPGEVSLDGLARP